MISVLVITYNEEENIGQCLDSLTWCDDVVVVDSFSTDRTKTLCARENVRFVEHEFGGWVEQRQWALDNVAFKHPWVLSLDADELVSSELRTEMLERVGKEPFAAYEMRFRLILWGRWVRRSSHYPVWITRLYLRDRVRYSESGATDLPSIDGPIGRLEADLIHENHKPVEDWLLKHIGYASREAAAADTSSPPDPRRLFRGATHLERRQELKKLWRHAPLRPAVYFLATYVLKGGFLDGRAGFRLAFLKASYEYWISIMKDERRGRGRP